MTVPRKIAASDTPASAPTARRLTPSLSSCAPPDAPADKPGDPIGYSIDLCNEVAEEVSKEFEGIELAVRYKKVTAETRIPAFRVEGVPE